MSRTIAPVLVATACWALAVGLGRHAVLVYESTPGEAGRRPPPGRHPVVRRPPRAARRS